jgi:hypothetical protein
MDCGVLLMSAEWRRCLASGMGDCSERVRKGRSCELGLFGDGNTEGALRQAHGVDIFCTGHVSYGWIDAG